MGAEGENKENPYEAKHMFGRLRVRLGRLSENPSVQFYLDRWGLPQNIRGPSLLGTDRHTSSLEEDVPGRECLFPSPLSTASLVLG